jgi:chromosome segregation protein
MMLKRLTVQGFKSFADRTEFDFDRGVTCIVGPNGCGKSNVVDAIKWVLGEQSAKSLRGSQMQDVIFSGSGTRKGSGMAQVDLTFDNNDRKLSVDAEEVTITRRLFRDGTSEYIVNGHDVRLKDIREMFMDTGVGFDAYSIIEQGRIEALLQANPLERRQLFDEAAGISKYRQRVKEALRKLERTDQNLLRVNDILEELGKRLRSVKVQAGRARSWQEYTIRLKELRSLYVLNEYRRYSTELEQRKKDLEIAREQSIAVHSQIAAHDADAATIDASIVQLDSKISAVESDLQIAASTVNTQRERISQTYRRMQESQEMLNSARLTARASRAQQQVLREKVISQQAHLGELDQEAAESKSRVEAMQAEDRLAAERIADIAHRVESAKSQLLDLVRQISHLRSEQAQGEDRARSLTAQRGRLADRLADARHQVEGIQQRCREVEQHLQELGEQQAEGQGRLKDLQDECESLDQRKAELTAELGNLKERRSGLLSRLQLLEELNRRYEGISPAVRTLLADRDDAVKAGQATNILGVLGELIEADLDDAGWIEGALAGLDQVILVDSREAILSQGAKYTNLQGKVQILALDAIRSDGIADVAMDGEPGFVGWASGRVRCDARYEPAVRWALGRIGLAETLADAVRMAERCPRGYRFISRDGQIVNAAGTLALGKGKSGTGLISRRSELRQISVDLRGLDAQIAERQEVLKATSAEFETLLEQSDDLRHSLQELQKVAVQNESQLRAERQNLQRLSQEEQLLEGEMGMLDEQVRQAAARAASAAERVKDLEASQAEVQQGIDAAQEEFRQAQAARAGVQERLTEVRVAAGKLAEKRAGVMASLHQTQRDVDRAQQEYQKSVSAVEMAGQRVLDAERTLLDAQQHLAYGYQKKEALQRTVLGLRKDRSEYRSELEKLNEALKGLRQQYEADEARFREQELAASQLQMRLETLVQRTMEDLQINLLEVEQRNREQGTGDREQPATAEGNRLQETGDSRQQQVTAETEQPQPEEIDWAAVEAEIAELRGKIERLGNVNLEAINEMAELEERLTFLSAQQKDLAESKRQLEELITRLN